jgi:uncharacterized membrane protein YoaK (UPF0700 family)
VIDIPKASPAEDRRLPPVLLALTFTTGLVDAVSYLGLGHVFTANMTGNVVLLGFGLAHTGGLPVLAPLVSLGAFLLGAAAGGRLALGIAADHERVVRVGIAVEVVFMAAAAILAAAVNIRIGSGAAYVVIALIAVAMGVRNAIVRKLAVPDLTTTVLTLTITGLAADAAAGHAKRGPSARRFLAVLVLLLGALCGALLEQQSLALPLAAAALIGAASLSAYIRARLD